MKFKYFILCLMIYSCKTSTRNIQYKEIDVYDNSTRLPAKHLPKDKEKLILNGASLPDIVGIDSAFYEEKHITLKDAKLIIDTVDLSLHHVKISIDSLTQAKKLSIRRK